MKKERFLQIKNRVQPMMKYNDDYYSLLPLNPGDIYTLPFGDETHTIQIIGDSGDGANMVVTIDGGEQRLMPRQMIQEAADYANKSGIEILIKQDTLQKENISPINEKSEVKTSKNQQNNIKTPSRKEEIIDNLGNIGCLVFVLLCLCLIFYTCNREKKERQAQDQRQEFVADSIEQRRQFEKDSIDSVHNSPEYKAYQDSLHLVWEKECENEEKSTVVMVANGDSLYHFMTMCIYDYDIDKIRLVSEYNAKKLGLKECCHCVRDIDGYIGIEDIPEYIGSHFDKHEIIEMFDLTSEDLW